MTDKEILDILGIEAIPFLRLRQARRQQEWLEQWIMRMVPLVAEDENTSPEIMKLVVEAAAYTYSFVASGDMPVDYSKWTDLWVDEWIDDPKRSVFRTLVTDLTVLPKPSSSDYDHLQTGLEESFKEWLGRFTEDVKEE